MDLKSDDNSYPPDCALRQYLKLFQEAVTRTRKPLDVAEKLKDNLISAGFIEVSKEVKKLPWSPWSTDEKMKELGRYALLNHETSLEASGSALFTCELGLSKDEAIRICSNAVEELKNGEIHAYNMHHFIIARRPL